MKMKIFRQFNEDTGSLMGSYVRGVKIGQNIPGTYEFANLLIGKAFDKMSVGQKVQFTGHSYLVRTK